MHNNGIKSTTLLVTSLSSFLVPFMGSAVNIAIPSIEKEFGLDAVSMNWIAAAYTLSTAMFLVPFGRVADICGRKKILLYGLAVFALSSEFSALSNSGAMLIASRIVQGIGNAMMFGTIIALLTSVFPPEERGKAIGINTAAVYLGLSLGPIIGGVLTHNFGWRILFAINVPLCVLLIALAGWKLKGEWADAMGEKFDWKGSVLYSISFACIMFGFSILPSIRGLIAIACGIACIPAFIVLELRTKSPVLDIRIFRRNPVFAFSNIASFIHYSASFATGFLLSIYLQKVKGLNAAQAGFVLVTQPVMMALVSPFAGRLSDRYEPRVISSIGMAITTAGLLPFVYINADTPLSHITTALVLLGIGIALFSAPNTNAIMSSVNRKCYGIAAAVTSTMRTAGQAFSMGIAAMVFAIYLDRSKISMENLPLFIDSLHPMFVVFAVMCFCGIFVSLARGRTR
ncbi:MAG: MFS transporter [Planctomycetes bacterium]|nr:MFS transporter [Planctomycetota bacterium]